MKTQALHRIRRSTWGKKVFVYFSLFAMLYQYTLSAYATALSTATIQTDFASNPLFNVASSSAAYKYVGNPYMEQSAPSASNLATFYNKLETDLRPNLGKPTFVPIDVSGITVFIPTYEKPRLIGSPLVQSRYVRYQVQNLLGRNLINSDVSAYATEAAQLNTLYENALDYIRYENSDVVYGENLNLDQANSGLAKDIVWPEFRVINGEKVVVPVIYLTESTYRERKITSHKSQFNGTTEFNNLTINEVEVKLGREAFLEIAGDLNNNRGIINASGDAQIAISGALNNFSGTISAQGNLTIGAHSINNETIVHRYDFGVNQSGRFGEVASINSVTGNVVLRSYSDILIQGGIVDATGEITFAANGNIFIGPVQYTEYKENSGHGWGSSLTQTEILQSRLTAEQTIKLIAQEAIKIDAAEIISDKGHIELLANLGITIEDEQKQYQYSSHDSWRNTDSNTSAYKTVAMRSVLDAGKGIRIHTDFGDITMRAADITSQTGTTVNAENGSVYLLLTKETDHYSYSSVTKDLFTIESISRGHNIETAVHNTIVGGFHVEALNGLNVQYEGIKDGTFEDQIENFRNIDGLAWMAELKDQVSADPNVQIDWDAVETVYEEWSEKNRSLSPAAMAVIMIVVAVCTAGVGTSIYAAAAGTSAASVGATTAAVMNAGFTAMVSTTAAASANATVNGGSFKEILESGYEAVLSENGAKNIAIAMVTAGAIAQVNAQFFDATKLGDSSALTATKEVVVGGVSRSVPALSLTGQVVQVTTQAAIQAGVSTLINGGDIGEFGDAFAKAVAQNAVSQIGEHMSTKIGEAFSGKNGAVDTALKYIAHAGAGCIIGAAGARIDEQSASRACGVGAAGAVTGEFIGSIYRSNEQILEAEEAIHDFVEKNGAYVQKLLDSGYSDSQIVDILNSSAEIYFYKVELIKLRKKGVDLAKLGAAIGAFALGADANDISISAEAATNSAMFNALSTVTASQSIIGAINELISEPPKIRSVGKLGNFGYGAAANGISKSFGRKATTLVAGNIPGFVFLLVSGAYESYQGISDIKEALELLELQEAEAEFWGKVQEVYEYSHWCQCTTPELLDLEEKLAVMERALPGLSEIYKRQLLIEKGITPAVNADSGLGLVVLDESMGMVNWPSGEALDFVEKIVELYPIENVKAQPNPSVIQALSEFRVAMPPDYFCTEGAVALLESSGGEGKIVVFGDKEFPWPINSKYNFGIGYRRDRIRVPVEGGSENFAHHTVYTDGRYFYDPLLSDSPIPQSDYIRRLKELNPEGISYRVLEPENKDLLRQGF